MLAEKRRFDAKCRSASAICRRFGAQPDATRFIHAFPCRCVVSSARRHEDAAGTARAGDDQAPSAMAPVSSVASVREPRFIGFSGATVERTSSAVPLMGGGCALFLAGADQRAAPPRRAG